MSAFEILVAIYLAVVPPALGFLFWGRLNRLETRMDSLGSELRSEMRAEISGLRGEVHNGFSQVWAEFSQVRSEISDVRQEVAALRSDLTQVALAVGARPRASEA